MGTHLRYYFIFSEEFKGQILLSSELLVLISGQLSKHPGQIQTRNPATFSGIQPHDFVKKNKTFCSFSQKKKKKKEKKKQAAWCHHWDLSHLEPPCETAVYLCKSQLPSSKAVILFLFPSSLFKM